MRHSSLCRTFFVGLLLTVCGGSKASASPATGSNNSAADSANSSAANGSPAQPAPTPPPPPPIVVPVGKMLTVTLDQIINSKIADNGDTFGGKGAAMGAFAGGGAGTAAAGFTGKKDSVPPAETRLHFKLVQSVSLQQGS
jgi:hypothetical protein